MALEQRLLTAPEDEKDVPMYQEDQDRINEFARLHMKHKQFQDRVAETKKTTEALDDASQDVMLIDTPDVAIRIGDAFFLMPTDEADEILEEEKRNAEQARDDARSSMSSLEDRMGTLKATLYAKFGKSIRLE